MLNLKSFKLKEIFSTWVLLSLKLVFINQVYKLVTDLLTKVLLFDIKIALKIFFFSHEQKNNLRWIKKFLSQLYMSFVVIRIYCVIKKIDFNKTKIKVIKILNCDFF